MTDETVIRTSNELCKVCEGLCCGEIPRLRKQIEILQHANRFLSEQIPSAHETPEQRPVAWMTEENPPRVASADSRDGMHYPLKRSFCVPLYTHAPKASEVRDSIAPNMHCPVCDRWFWTDKFDGHKCVSQGK